MILTVLIISAALVFSGSTPSPHQGLRWTGPGTCLACHESEAKEMHGSVHNQWMGEAPYAVNGPPRQGKLALAHAATNDKNYDLHMATTGRNMSCQTCHQTKDHRIAGRGSDLRQTDLDVKMNCSTSSCHQDKASPSGHEGAIGRHVNRVACQTCHISTYARNAADTAATEATEVHRDWTKPQVTASGVIHPTPTMANDLKPVYRFWNGTSTNHNLGDTAWIDPATGRGLVTRR